MAPRSTRTLMVSSSSASASSSSSLSDLIALTSINLYNSLPSHGKPALRDNGVREWTILSTVCLVTPSSANETDRVKAISLGTGVKVLPISKLPPVGDAIHDSHAEIMARRGFLRWLLHQGNLLSGRPGDQNEREEIFVEWTEDKTVRLKENVHVWIYVSALPCGDASTLYTAAHQSEDEAAQWLPTTCNSSSSSTSNGVSTSSTVIRGRNGYSTISALRTKPGRPDSIPSLSMSCSDKLASWSILGLQGGLLARGFEPVYLDGIVIGGVERPESEQDSRWEEVVRSEVERAIWGRLEILEPHIPHPYSLHRPRIHLTSIQFPDSKSSILSQLSIASQSNQSLSLDPTPSTSPSTYSLSYLPFLILVPTSSAKSIKIKPEIISNGTKISNHWKSPGHIPIREIGRSKLCKLEIMRSYLNFIKINNQYWGEKQDIPTIPNLDDGLWTMTYYSLKHLPKQDLLQEPAHKYEEDDRARRYQYVKYLLRGIPSLLSLESRQQIKGFEKYPNIQNTIIPTCSNNDHCDGQTTLDNEETNGKNESIPTPTPPFLGWLVSGEDYESFNFDGTYMRSR